MLVERLEWFMEIGDRKVREGGAIATCELCTFDRLYLVVTPFSTVSSPRTGCGTCSASGTRTTMAAWTSTSSR